MPLIANDEGGGTFQLAPVGTHVAYCARVVDFGHQNDEWQGAPRIQHRISLGFELPTKKAVFDEAKGEEPFVVSKEYTLSLHENANLRHDLEAWRGQQFTKEELAGFDLEKILGAPCLVTVVHHTTASKKVVAKITNVTGVPDEMLSSIPPMTTEKLFYTIDMGINPNFQKLPEWQRKKILTSREHTDEPEQSQANAADAAAAGGPAKTTTAPAQRKMPF